MINPGIQPYEPDDFFREIPDLENKRILDVGASIRCTFGLAYLNHLRRQQARECGSIVKAFEESEKFKDDVIAIDTEFKVINNDSSKAKSEGRELALGWDIPIAYADARGLPFKDRSFDIVAMGYLLDTDDFKRSGLEKAVREAARVLKSSGYLIGDIKLYPELAAVAFKESLGMLSSFKLQYIRWRHLRQMEKYQRVIENSGMEFLKKGIAFTERYRVLYHPLTFYFIAKKRE